MDPDVFSFMGVMATIAGFIFVMTLCRGLMRRLGGGSRCACEAGDHDELHFLRDRVTDLEHDVGRVEELEERLDFAERMLAEARDPERIPGHRDQSSTPA